MARRTRATPEQVAELIAAFRAGETPAQIAAARNWPVWNVYGILHRHGFNSGKPGPRPGTVKRPDKWRFTEAEVQNLLLRAQSGEPVSRIAEELHCHPMTIHRALWRVGMPRKSKTGRSIDRNGYALVYRPGHVMAMSNGYVLEHRWVMSEMLGRPLADSETVHHIDGDRLNNARENLQLRHGRHGKGARFTCLDCGSHNVAAVTLGPSG
jgi:hypothetical protein